jgi:hypothetical protein
MESMENFSDEVVLKILGYLGLGDLIQCAKVSKRLNNICKDKSLGYSSSMKVMKNQTVKDQKSIRNILIAMPRVKEVILRNPSNSLETRKKRVRTEDHREHEKAALHFMIFGNKLVLQVFYLHLYASNDPYLWIRLSTFHI